MITAYQTSATALHSLSALLFSSAFELKAQAMLMQSPLVRRLSVRLSVNFGGTNLYG